MSFPILLTTKAFIILLLIILPSIILIGTQLLEQDFWIYMLILLFYILVASIVIPIRYIRAHTKDAPEKYFIEFGASRAIKDYYLSKIFLYCAIAVPIIFQVIVYLSQIIISAFSLTLGGILSTYLMYLFLISITLAIKLALQHSRNDFNFYLAKAYVMVGSQRQDDFEKFKALVLLLDTYNKFLERNLKLKIRDIMRIYS